MSAWTMKSEKWMGPGPPIKRKERDGTLSVSKPSPLTTKKLAKPSPHHRHPPKPSQKKKHLLAGYLAHEFLSKGTLFGQVWGPDRGVGSSRMEPTLNSNGEAKGALEEKYVRYKEVSYLMTTHGVHIPATVNPTQLARFLGLG